MKRFIAVPSLLVLTDLAFTILVLTALALTGLALTGSAYSDESLPEVSPELTQPLAIPLPDAKIVVHKARRQLLLYSGDRLLRRVPIGLGFQPSGTKRRQGDGATPEGEYFVCVKNPQSQYYLSLGINYPNSEDAEHGLKTETITERDHRRIVAAERGGRTPPWDTPLGGEIFIHGRGSGSDWTLGCIALDDPAMKELFDAVEVGTPVIIEP